jgi:glucose-1-phosphate thymidylyltransferase
MIRKAIVLAAGKGTRLMPMTLAIPKEMIRIGTKPAIEHAINVLKAGGVQELLIIVGRRKEAIMDYLGSGKRLGVDIYYRIQEEPKGTADAVSCGRVFLTNGDFAVIYGDNYIKPPEIMKEIVEFHEGRKADATIVLHHVKDPTRFGIVKVDSNDRVVGMVEKPTPEEAELYKVGNAFLGIAGLMILNSKIFDFIERTAIGKEGEKWLTDALQIAGRSGLGVYGFIFKGVRHDVGTFESIAEADRLESGAS